MKPQPPRTPSKLSDSVHHQLNMYALAASAAGVGMLALAQPAEARVVYTQTHRVIGGNEYYNLDLNHDGIVDFILSNYASYSTFVFALAQGSNGVAGKRWAYALFAGACIGPALPFQASRMARYDSKGQSLLSGSWVNVKNRYLGLNFKIKGKTHYGWARLSVKFTPDQRFTATLTGYAYETIPNKAIIAGQTKGPDVITVRPASLGHLAAGASAIPVWRLGK